MLARCSMTVVTMWFPFSLYISATPLRARLIASVPPEVKTSSFGSRAPISVAILARAASTAPSASHPNGWLRLAGCPNFSVKYGSIASTTRGSHGVVDCASMKIGNFSAIGTVSSRPDRQKVRHVLVRQLREIHRVEHLGDRRLELLDRPAEVAPRLLRTASVVEAAHNADGSLQRPNHFAHRDIARVAREHVAALRAVLAHDQPPLRQALQDLGEELRRNTELLGDSLGAHRPDIVMDGDIMNRHQAIVGALGEAEHLVDPRSTATVSIGDLFSRTLHQPGVCQAKWLRSRIHPSSSPRSIEPRSPSSTGWLLG